MQNGVRAQLTSVVFALFAVVWAPHAAATSIPVGTAPADDLIVTYYFLSSTPGPPYSFVTIDLNINGWDSDETITFDFFADQVGLGGLLHSETRSGGIPSVTFLTFDPNLVDGQFSVGVRLSSGAADLTSTTATADDWITVDGIVDAPGPVIDEPATLALLGVGLVGLGFGRRKR